MRHLCVFAICAFAALSSSAQPTVPLPVQRVDGTALLSGLEALQVAREAHLRSDYQTSLVHLHVAAEAGVPKAMYLIGSYYALGGGVSIDLVEAVRWYRAAADNDFAAAQYELGSAFEKGSGIEPNLEEARRWYQRAADNGHADAIEALTRLNPRVAGSDQSIRRPLDLAQTPRPTTVTIEQARRDFFEHKALPGLPDLSKAVFIEKHAVACSSSSVFESGLYGLAVTGNPQAVAVVRQNCVVVGRRTRVKLLPPRNPRAYVGRYVQFVAAANVSDASVNTGWVLIDDLTSAEGRPRQ